MQRLEQQVWDAKVAAAQAEIRHAVAAATQFVHDGLRDDAHTDRQQGAAIIRAIKDFVLAACTKRYGRDVVAACNMDAPAAMADLLQQEAQRGRVEQQQAAHVASDADAMPEDLPMRLDIEFSAEEVAAMLQMWPPSPTGDEAGGSAAAAAVRAAAAAAAPATVAAGRPTRQQQPARAAVKQPQLDAGQHVAPQQADARGPAQAHQTAGGHRLYSTAAADGQRQTHRPAAGQEAVGQAPQPRHPEAAVQPHLPALPLPDEQATLLAQQIVAAWVSSCDAAAARPSGGLAAGYPTAAAAAPQKPPPPPAAAAPAAAAAATRAGAAAAAMAGGGRARDGADEKRGQRARRRQELDEAEVEGLYGGAEGGQFDGELEAGQFNPQQGKRKAGRARRHHRQPDSKRPAAAHRMRAPYDGGADELLLLCMPVCMPMCVNRCAVSPLDPLAPAVQLKVCNCRSECLMHCPCFTPLHQLGCRQRLGGSSGSGGSRRSSSTSSKGGA